MPRFRIEGLVLLIAVASACTGSIPGDHGPLKDGATGPVDAAIPFEPVPPTVYVAKVKDILVGVPPTDDEIAQVTADPTTLPTLINHWMTDTGTNEFGTPYATLYQNKMMVFFELAFQQTQISVADFVNIIPTSGLGNGLSPPLLVQNIRESFARTVVALTAQGQPLTNAFTTKQLMMTPALMAFYAYLDTRRADDSGKITDSFATANNGKKIVIEATRVIARKDSLDPKSADYLTFYNPDIKTQKYAHAACNGVDPITTDSTDAATVFDILFGSIPFHTISDGFNCPVRPGVGTGLLFTPADFTSWQLVTVAPPAGDQAITPFFNLDGLEALQAQHQPLLLQTPRPGFFSTPAFFANWPTNASNQMRVTVNQALIVATGSQVDGADVTVPSSTPGLDPVHEQPGTACYFCHKLLDPTRSILSATYSWFYNPQTDATLLAQPGLFAFEGVVNQVSTIDDFANQLATHPLTPQAWAQKLCYYANSAPCDPTDPLFKAIVTRFSNGFSWNGLVTDLLSSPITTDAAYNKTHDTNGEVIAVSRRDHLCAALDARLGFVDICQLDESDKLGKPLTVIGQIVGGMPSDGYGRGSTIPVLPNQPTLFYRSGVENLCAAVSEMVVDATAAAKAAQPGARQWTSTDPTAAIADFVSLVIGLRASDPRAALINTALTTHFTTALAAPSKPSATDALRSTFVTACLSPSFIGIGL